MGTVCWTRMCFQQGMIPSNHFFSHSNKFEQSPAKGIRPPMVFSWISRCAERSLLSALFESSFFQLITWYLIPIMQVFLHCGGRIFDPWRFVWIARESQNFPFRIRREQTIFDTKQRRQKYLKEEKRSLRKECVKKMKRRKKHVWSDGTPTQRDNMDFIAEKGN